MNKKTHVLRYRGKKVAEPTPRSNPYVVTIKVGSIQQIVLGEFEAKGVVLVRSLVLDVDGTEWDMLSRMPLALPPGTTLSVSIEGNS